MDNADIQHLYATRHIDFFLLLSSSEGTPIALCEALAYGIPALASHVGGLPALLGATGGGITVDPSLAPDAFLAAATGIIESAPLRRSLRAAARANWETNLNATRLRPAFASLLASL